jgi:soluble lytic murein transglycosylase-like protein
MNFTGITMTTIKMYSLLAIIAISIFATTLLPRGSDTHVSVRYPVELPLHITRDAGMTWTQETAHFAEQLMRAFDISPEKAAIYSPIIIRASIQSDISEIVLASIIMTESTFKEDAVSHVGAYGATQIRPIYWEQFCSEINLDIYSLEGNVNCGATIVSFLMESYCEFDITCALEHYNVGRTNLLTSAKHRQAGKRYTTKIQTYKNQLERHLYTL